MNPISFLLLSAIFFITAISSKHAVRTLHTMSITPLDVLCTIVIHFYLKSSVMILCILHRQSEKNIHYGMFLFCGRSKCFPRLKARRRSLLSGHRVAHCCARHAPAFNTRTRDEQSSRSIAQMKNHRKVVFVVGAEGVEPPTYSV